MKRMFKVLSPIERKDGSTYWFKLGNAMTNKDDSINIYLDAYPKEMKLQLRELSEEELRERDERRSSYAARDRDRGTASFNRNSNGNGNGTPPLPKQDSIPF